VTSICDKALEELTSIALQDISIANVPTLACLVPGCFRQ